MEQTKRRWPFLRKRAIPLPTWRGWLLLLLVAVLFCWWALHGIYPFLAPNAPIAARVLVVEGWAPDYVMERAVQEFRSKPYDKLYVTGGPIEHGAPLCQYNDYATLGAAVILKLGLQTNVVQAVPAPFVPQDRTYTSAVTLRQWLKDHGGETDKINILSAGPHARRSRLLYRKAFGSETKFGIVAVPEVDFNPAKWWKTSQGFRTVTSELIAYLYAKVFFHPSVGKFR